MQLRMQSPQTDGAGVTGQHHRPTWLFVRCNMPAVAICPTRILQAWFGRVSVRLRSACAVAVRKCICRRSRLVSTHEM
jgi:hypothetical protein